MPSLFRAAALATALAMTLLTPSLATGRKPVPTATPCVVTPSINAPAEVGVQATFHVTWQGAVAGGVVLFVGPQQWVAYTTACGSGSTDFSFYRSEAFGSSYIELRAVAPAGQPSYAGAVLAHVDVRVVGCDLGSACD